MHEGWFENGRCTLPIKVNCWTTDTTVLNQVIFPKLSVARFSLIFVAALLSSLKSTTQKRGFVKKKYFTVSMPMLTPNHTFKTHGGPKNDQKRP